MEIEDDECSSYYDGTMSRPGEEERCHDPGFSMSQHLLDGLRTDLPFHCRLEFIKCVAASCRRYRAEVQRKVARPNKETYKMLWSAFAPDRLE